MRKLRVDVILLGQQRVLLEHLLDGKPEGIPKPTTKGAELLEGLENMLSDVIDSLLRDDEVVLRNVCCRTTKGGVS